jgi:hypothetical protein
MEPEVEPAMTELSSCQPLDYRLESLRLAVALYGRREYDGRRDYDGDRDRDRDGRRDYDDRREQDHFIGDVVDAYGTFLGLLTARPAGIIVGDPVIAEQATPARTTPLTRKGPGMAVTITDTQQATYPAASETDSKGFPVTGDTITIAEDSGGTVVAMTQNADGSVTFTAVAPGAAQVSWTDGTLSFADTINVTAGAAAVLVIGTPEVADQPPPGT